MIGQVWDERGWWCGWGVGMLAGQFFRGLIFNSGQGRVGR